MRLLGDRLARSALGLRLLAAFVAVPLYLSTAWVAAPEETIDGLIIVFPALIGRSLAELVRSVFLARQNVRRNFSNIIAFHTAEVVLGIVLLWMGSGV